MILGRKIWGPYAWHLLHTFSINNNFKISEMKKHQYYIFYTSFAYVLPCMMCRDHYYDIIYNKLPLNEKDINRQYLKRWVFDVHNIVNKLLKKPKYSYKRCINDNEVINHGNILLFMEAVYKSFDYNNMSLYNFDHIYNFFKYFCLLYPDKNIKKDFKKIIKSDSFKKIQTPKEFQNWIKSNFSKLNVHINKID